MVASDFCACPSSAQVGLGFVLMDRLLGLSAPGTMDPPYLRSRATVNPPLAGPQPLGRGRLVRISVVSLFSTERRTFPRPAMPAFA